MSYIELDDETWPEFIAQKEAVLVLTRNDCDNCSPFVKELSSKEFPVGVIILDKPGTVGFKTAYPRIAVEASVLPFSILFCRGEWMESIMGARVGTVLEWFE
ncbi:MAG TPA: hypothetical protein QF646_03565 [Candidatus Poseidoniales archaeon]|jgi:hypothetical protein|nr:hypothetical protein [Candidatus Thalassarchaeaceae archaeon]HJL59618.1 hypothetical protein [Candidatus Thalassarchaeaceae archaeon]HJM18997.1 hypothetical protein [Candidatus Thalassarchaeaceae archaeon]HJN55449.1 hypothetical protein [Candidatus Poseidoniales archaeon]